MTNATEPVPNASELTLSEFLLARIAEDEAVAMKEARWRWGRGDTAVRGVLFQADGVRIEWARIVDAETIEESVEELTLDEFDERAEPLVARPLAECAAKRAIVDWCGPAAQWLLNPDRNAYDEEPVEFAGEVHMAAGVLRALASVYADHPDCREEWR